MTSHSPFPYSFDAFPPRHIGPDAAQGAAMAERLGVRSAAELTKALIPDDILLSRPLNLPPARTEQQVQARLRELASDNVQMRQMIGLGYFDTVTPAVIRRNVLESPAWYTAYTPYQPEIAQGRLEALLVFQTMVEDLTGLDIANASLLDEATAVAEAVALMWRATKAKSGYVALDADLLPQSLAVVRGRAEAIGLPVVVADLSRGLDAAADAAARLPGGVPGDLVGVVLPQCGASGRIADWRGVVTQARDRGAMVTMTCDLLAATMLVSPGELGADVAVGSAQRLGVPLFYGGPHAAFMAVRKGLERSLPGRLVGVSVDADGAPAYRLALQTREQHIRRERATSNICTAQALLAIVAAMYAVYHGPDGLRAIAQRTHAMASALASALRAGGIEVRNEVFFDTVRAVVPGGSDRVRAIAESEGINLYAPDADHVQISCDETTTINDLDAVALAFGVRPVSEMVGGIGAGKDAVGAGGQTIASAGGAPASSARDLPAWAARVSEYLTHPVFHTHHNETSMMRYLRRLSDKDLALDRSMIPLGSCTMKLNAAVEMEAISWPGFAGIHPLAPADQVLGYDQLVGDLGDWLAEITGYAAVSFQPNAGAQGELAGLLAIRGYHRSRGEADRDVCLIPASAHGTNAASAAMAGLRVVVVGTAGDGSIDLDDLRAKLDQHGDRVAAIMITYPSTHGVYEGQVREVCQLVHAVGGQVYIDGANLNALVGYARPGDFGGDVSHLNLHKTFAIPHGGGGPGVGPIGMAAHLAPFAPSGPYVPGDGMRGDDTAPDDGPAPVSESALGSAGILPISYAYIALMGAEGLTAATEAAVLAANYVARALDPYFPVLYTDANGGVAHECILDLRPLTAATGVTAEDVAKRLMDYGFHAPTLAFPVPGTLMVEPTESEDLAELDRFIAAMIAIRGEIDRVAAGEWPVESSPLRGAPHTAACVVADGWDRPYSRELAVYPAGHATDKYWPPVRRIDGARGDRNLVCACPPLETYAE